MSDVGRKNRRPFSAFVWIATAGAAAALALSCAARDQRERPPTDPGAVRTTATGDVVGFSGPYGSHVWLGIPYAAPPLGDLRWRAPRPPASWSARREAVDFGSPCPQLASPFGGLVDRPPGTPGGDEDCLFLNVYAPRFAAADLPGPGARLPVMLWIHGGGNVIGHASFYDGGNLAAQENVVVVTVNYRLGPLGWFRHAALRDDARDAAEASGNFGTLDLIRALEWVRDNAAAFGGDPANVTIFGESAGARDVVSLLLAPAAAGLFHRAIVQSGGVRMVDPATAENFSDAPQAGHRHSSNEILLRLLIADGRAADRAAAKRVLSTMSLADTQAYLRGQSPQRLLAMYQTEANEGLIEAPNVFADGVAIASGDPLQIFASGTGFNRVPVIFGTNRDESKIFMFARPEWVRRRFWIIPQARDAVLYEAVAGAASALWKLDGVDAPAAALSATPGPPVFAYRWDWDEEPTVLGADLSKLIGAAHGLEISFVFGHFELGPEGKRLFDSEGAPARMQLSRAMMSYWAEFARHGSPGRGGDGKLTEWRAWEANRAAAEKFLVLDTERDGGLRMSSAVVQRDAVLEAIAANPQLPDQRRRCEAFAGLSRWSPSFKRTDYDQRCPDHPLESPPGA